jgi:hypothetical protein
MSRVTIIQFTSDLTGKAIEEGKACTLRIVRESDPDNVIEIDANEDEVKNLLDKGITKTKPGRKAAG